MSSYTTIGGDTFDAISRKTTGTGAQAGAIRAANPGVLEPIPAGISLTVPDMPPPVVFPAPKNKSNEISLMLDGSRFRYWTEISISREYDTIDKIEFSAPFDTDNYSFVELFKPLTYKSAQVMIGNQALFTGTIVSVTPDFKSDSGTVSVSAYAKAGVLMDCCPPAASLPLEFKNMTLDVIAAAVCAPFGILTSFEGSAGGPFKRIRIEPDNPVFGQLADLAVQRNQYMGSDVLGNLVFRTADTSGAHMAQLDGGRSPVISVSPDIDSQSYFSEVTGFVGSKSGFGGTKYTVKNPLLKGVTRPYSFSADDIKRSEIADAVKGKMARMLGSFIRYSVAVDTWRDPAGALWEPGTFIDLIAPRAMVYKSYRFFVRSVTLDRKNESETAVLGLTLPGAYSGEMPAGLPWD